jgi:di/tricarboxylate transporter
MMTPIFINIAFQLHVHPEVLVIGLIIGGSNALATPIGTPCVTQTLVGGYRYKDYVYVGLPITIILTVLTCILLPLMYGFTPL